MISEETNLNLTLGNQYTTLAQSQDNQNNPLADFLVYLFAIMCSENDTCANVLEIGCAVVIGAISLGIATLPANADSIKYKSTERAFAKIAMTALWATSVYGGYYAATKEYDHYQHKHNNIDSIDTLNAFSNAAFSGAIVTAIFTGMSAGIVHAATPKIVHMYNSTRNACRTEQSIHCDGYERLQENDVEGQAVRPRV